MDECTLYADAESDEGSDPRLSRHLAECGRCRRERDRIGLVVTFARAVYGGDTSLPAAARRRIALQAAQRSGRPWRVPALLAGLPWRVRPGFLAAAAAVVLAVLLLPLGQIDRPHEDAIQALDVMEGPGGVTLAWSNGGDRAYVVYKSADPRTFSHAEAHTVSGTKWTDTRPDSSPVVYYKIEHQSATN